MIREALFSIPANERDTWVRCGMAVKSELGDAGFEVWNAWSKQAESYRERDAKAVWSSIKPYGGITIGTLYAEAKRYGWKGDGDVITVDYNAIRRQQQATQQRDNAKHKKAANDAHSMLRRAEMMEHDYLTRKGFPDRKGLVLGTQLLIPMRDCKTNALTGLQTIQPWGEKKFLPGTKAKGATFKIGQGFETWLCEGYATALSVLMALQGLHCSAAVVVTFSAANLAHVAGLLKGKRYIVADHDESGTGERYAAKARIPFWMPPTLGDANDFHQSEGLRALALELLNLRNSRTGNAARYRQAEVL